MPALHFLNVLDGDCTLIQHGSGRVTMIDVNNARSPEQAKRATASLRESAGVPGNFNQKAHPVNPIEYMRDRSIGGPFRFVLTHPDMDHMDGIADVFAEFSPPNFWDTANTCDKDSDDWENSPYRKEDWDFYRRLRSDKAEARRLVYHSCQSQLDFWREDGLSVLAPTPALVSAANKREDWNDSSYVVMYTLSRGDDVPPWKVVMPGDSHDGTWEHILDVHAKLISNIDVLLAPHHGRDSDRDHSFLDILKPKLTLFGNAKSQHLGYGEWSRRKLPVVTNNQAGCVIVDFNNEHGLVYATNQAFAQASIGEYATFDEDHKAWLCGLIQ